MSDILFGTGPSPRDFLKGTGPRRPRLDDETRTDIDHKARRACIEMAKHGVAIDVAWAPELRPRAATLPAPAAKITHSAIRK